MPTSLLASFFPTPRKILPWSQPSQKIGLDMDSQAITFVELRQRHGREYISRWGYEELAPNIIEDGRIKNPSVLVGALKAFVEKYRLRGASVAMGVNGASVMVKRVHVPRNYQQNLDEYLMWEGAQYIPYDPEDVYLDFSLCSSNVLVETSDDLDLLLIAAKREAVDERRTILEEAHLVPVICDVESLAFLNLASMSAVVQTQGTYLIANLRENLMNVAVMVQGEPLLVRDVKFSSVSRPNGPNMISDEYDQDLRRNREQSFYNREPSLSEKMLWIEIVSELKRTVEGAREMLPDLDIGTVFLSGRLGESFGLQEELKQSLLIPVNLLALTLPLESDEERVVAQPLAPFANIAEGLALRAFHG